MCMYVGPWAMSFMSIYFWINVIQAWIQHWRGAPREKKCLTKNHCVALWELLDSSVFHPTLRAIQNQRTHIFLLFINFALVKSNSCYKEMSCKNVFFLMQNRDLGTHASCFLFAQQTPGLQGNEWNKQSDLNEHECNSRQRSEGLTNTET